MCGVLEKKSLLLIHICFSNLYLGNLKTSKTKAETANGHTALRIYAHLLNSIAVTCMYTWGSIQLLPTNTKLLKFKLIQTAEVRGHSTPSFNVPATLGIKPQAICKNKPSVMYQMEDTASTL